MSLQPASAIPQTKLPESGHSALVRERSSKITTDMMIVMLLTHFFKGAPRAASPDKDTQKHAFQSLQSRLEHFIRVDKEHRALEGKDNQIIKRTDLEGTRAHIAKDINNTHYLTHNYQQWNGYVAAALNAAISAEINRRKDSATTDGVAGKKEDLFAQADPYYVERMHEFLPRIVETITQYNERRIDPVRFAQLPPEEIARLREAERAAFTQDIAKDTDALIRQVLDEVRKGSKDWQGTRLAAFQKPGLPGKK